MTTLHPQQMDELAQRYEHVLRQSSSRRLRPLIFGVSFVAYVLFCWWFFSLGTVLSKGNWSLAGTYLADWVTYDVRPELKIRPDGYMTIDYGRFSPLGNHPDPAWVKLERQVVSVSEPADVTPSASSKKSTIGFMAPAQKKDANDVPAETKPLIQSREVISRAEVTIGSVATITVADRLAKVAYDGDTLQVQVDGKEKTEALQPLPKWATQKYADGKIVLAFGMNGWAEIDADEVSIHNRFFGWANFFFDTKSPFFGKTFFEVMSIIVSGERLDPTQSNLALAWNNVLYNEEWQHLDVWTKLLQTIVMAFAGTVLASALAFPLCFVAARNITRNTLVNQLAKRFFDFQRSVDMLIWALFFTRAFGPGPIAGISAIFFTDTGTFGKLYSEALENIDDKPREGVKSVGAPPLAVQRFGVLPQVLPVFVSQSLYFWESNTRSATIIGAVGAGGIGLKLWEAMRTNADWENVAYMVLLILIVVFVFDGISNALRSRLIGPQRT